MDYTAGVLDAVLKKKVQNPIVRVFAARVARMLIIAMVFRVRHRPKTLPCGLQTPAISATGFHWDLDGYRRWQPAPSSCSIAQRDLVIICRFPTPHHSPIEISFAGRWGNKSSSSSCASKQTSETGFSVSPNALEMSRRVKRQCRLRYRILVGRNALRQNPLLDQPETIADADTGLPASTNALTCPQKIQGQVERQ